MKMSNKYQCYLGHIVQNDKETERPSGNCRTNKYETDTLAVFVGFQKFSQLLNYFLKRKLKWRSRHCLKEQELLNSPFCFVPLL